MAGSRVGAPLPSLRCSTPTATQGLDILCGMTILREEVIRDLHQFEKRLGY
jgi:hypothetical protein